MKKLNSIGVVIVPYLFLFSDFDFKWEEFSIQFSFNIFVFSYTAIITRYKYGLGLMLCNPHTACEFIISVGTFRELEQNFVLQVASVIGK